MTYQNDLPRRASICPSQKTKESKREESLQALGCKLPFFPGMGLSWRVSLLGVGWGVSACLPPTPSQACTVRLRSSLQTKAMLLHALFHAQPRLPSGGYCEAWRPGCIIKQPFRDFP